MAKATKTNDGKGTPSRPVPTNIVIPEPNFRLVQFGIIGTAPYVQLKFSEKARGAMMAKMAEGSRAQKGKKRDPRDFDDDYRQALHTSEEGWCGIPAAAFRNSMISACKIVGFHMTKGKLAIFVVADGVDASEGTPLVRIEGEPEKHVGHVRNANGVADIRVRAMWPEWRARLTIRYDGDMFGTADVSNLLLRAGMQVGIGEGRPDSKNSNGMGWGTFRIEDRSGAEEVKL